MRSRSWSDRKRTYGISIDPYYRLEHIYGVFIALACLHQKYCPKTASDHSLKWHWRLEKGSLVEIFRFRMSSLHVTRCLSVFQKVFVQKMCLSTFSHWLIIDRSQIWPDIRSHTFKFRDKYFIFMIWWPGLEWPGSGCGSEIFTEPTSVSRGRRTKCWTNQHR